VGESVLDATITRERGRLRVDVVSKGPGLDLHVVMPVPPGARHVTARAGGSESGAGGPEPELGRHDATVTRTLSLEDASSAFAEVTWDGGLSVAAPLVGLVPGQTSDGIRVVDFAAQEGGWILELEGVSGRSYEIRLFGVTPIVTEAAGATAVVRPGDGVADDPHTLHVSFQAGSGRALARIRLGEAG